MQTPPVIFDRDRVRRNRAQTMAAPDALPDIRTHDNAQLLDRLLDVTRNFESALAFGSDAAHTATHLLNGRHAKAVTCGHFCEPETLFSEQARDVSTVIYDEEWVPFKDDGFDLVIGARALHWVNDLPGALIQLRRCLKPDGLFLTSLLGGQTLHELRACLAEAEAHLRGGVSPRVSPFVDVRDAGDLLVRAGFALPVADTDTVVMEYASLVDLFAALKNMGETGAVMERPRTLSTPRLFALAEEIYKDRFQSGTGHLQATFEIITLTGWSPAENQQQPLARGSAKQRLSEALGTEENQL